MLVQPEILTAFFVDEVKVGFARFLVNDVVFGAGVLVAHALDYSPGGLESKPENRYSITGIDQPLPTRLNRWEGDTLAV